jgi:hypothetical protein
MSPPKTADNTGTKARNLYKPNDFVCAAHVSQNPLQGVKDEYSKRASSEDA